MNIIVAASKNMGIGFENQLPWFLKKELQYFKNKTIGTDKNNIILTGKKLCISRSTRMLNFRQKNPFGAQFFSY